MNNTNSNKDAKTLAIAAIGVVGVSTLGYYIYNSIFGGGSKKDSSSNKNLKSSTSTKTENEHIGNEVKDDAVEDNKAQNNTQNTQKDEILKFHIFSECLKRVCNHTFEQLFIFSDVLLQNFNKNGEFIGTDMTLNRPLHEMQRELLGIISQDVSRITLAFGLTPDSYNKSLQENLAKNTL